MIAQLASPEAERRQEAYQALLDRGAKDPQGVLALLPQADPDPEVAEACRRLRRGIPRENIRWQALEDVRGDPRMCRAAEELFTAPSLETIRTLERTCTSLGAEEKGVRILACFLDDESSRLRLCAVASLGRLGERSAAPELVKRVEDPDPLVQKVAIQALIDLGERSVAPELVKRLADPRHHVRSQAIYALGRLGEKTAAPEIVKLLLDPKSNVRSQAADALVRLDEKSVAPQIEKLLTNRDADVRANAAACLENLLAR